MSRHFKLKQPDASQSLLPLVVISAVACTVPWLVFPSPVEAQVGDIVVGLDTIHVINKFVSLKWSAQGTCHYEAVLRDTTALSPACQHRLEKCFILGGNSGTCEKDVALRRVDFTTGSKDLPFPLLCPPAANSAATRETVRPYVDSCGIELTVALFATLGAFDSYMGEPLVLNGQYLGVAPVHAGMLNRFVLPVNSVFLDQAVFIALPVIGSLLDSMSNHRGIIKPCVLAERASDLHLHVPVPTHLSKTGPIDLRMLRETGLTPSAIAHKHTVP